MYFIASKILWLIFAPGNLLLLLAVAGLLLLYGQRTRAARLCLSLALLGLFIIGFFPLGDRLADGLERQFPAWKDDGRPVNGVIVLGGRIDVGASTAWDALALNGAGNRLIAMADLARRYPGAKIVFSGGSGELFSSELSESDIVERHSAELGIAPGRILIERRSRNTKENAEYTKAMLTPAPGERWLLVTSAWHMPRAMGLFRKAGWTVEAYPTGWISAPGHSGSTFLTEASSHWLTFDQMAREWAGLIAARMLGQSDALLPGPDR